MTLSKPDMPLVDSRIARCVNSRLNSPMKLFVLLTLIVITAVFPKILHANSDLIRNIVLVGNETYTEDQISDVMRSQIGADYDAGNLKQDLEQIVVFYQSNGFQFARIDEEQVAIKRFSDGVYLRIPIDEGKIGKITVTGNTRSNDHVIQRELLFQVGDTYTVEDELESERILRRKPYLGKAEIVASRDAETQLVWIQVEVADLWSFIPALDLPAFNKDSSNLLIMLSDSNLFGSGNRGRIRYQLIREEGEEPRSLIRSRYTASRMFDSYWEFDGQFTQKREGDSWQVRLKRPQYSLKTRWSADFTLSESIDEIRWYENGAKTDTFTRSQQIHSARATHYFGSRHKQTQVSLWASSQKSDFNLIEKIAPSDANFENRNLKIVGITLGRRHVDFIRTRFLNQMGRVEDFEVGYRYGVSIGHASPLFDSDRTQTNLSVRLAQSQAHQDFLFLNAHTELATRLTEQLGDSVLTAKIKTTCKDLLYQTLVAQISTVMGFDLGGRRQVILGGTSGLRGYSSWAFSGEKKMLLNLESRTIFKGGIFKKVEPLIVIGSAIFADVGYVWNGAAFNLREPKRSIGFGLRFNLPKLTESRVYRLDLAYPLDVTGKFSFKPVITYGIGHVF